MHLTEYRGENTPGQVKNLCRQHSKSPLCDASILHKEYLMIWDWIIVIASALLGGFYFYPWIHKRWGKVCNKYNHALLKFEGGVILEKTEEKTMWRLGNFIFNDKLVQNMGMIEFTLIVISIQKIREYTKDDEV